MKRLGEFLSAARARLGAAMARVRAIASPRRLFDAADARLAVAGAWLDRAGDVAAWATLIFAGAYVALRVFD